MDAPFWDHPSFIRYLARNMKRGQDNIVLYDGEEGSGKSNAKIWDAIHLHAAMKTRPYDPGVDPIFSMEDWDEKFDAAEKMVVYDFDEFENFAFSRDHSTFDQKRFIKIAQQIRILRSTFLLALPYFGFTDVYFRQGRVRIRVTCRRVTEVDVSCPLCSSSHEIREATYHWRRRTEDMTSGEVAVAWEEVFVARHCPLALVRPDDWSRYETRKEARVREAAEGGGDRRRRGRRDRPTKEAEPTTVGGRRMQRIEELRSIQDRLKKLGLPYKLEIVEPPTPTTTSNRRPKRKVSSSGDATLATRVVEEGPPPEADGSKAS